MSNILSRMPIIFEDENGNILPHRDSASNSYFNSANTGLNSDNVEDAIKEVNSKINNSSGSAANCNIVRLEDCEGYESRFALDEYPTYRYRNPTNNALYTLDNFYSDSQNSDILDLAKDTTEFLQGVINNLSPSDILMFPKDKIFMIAHGDKAYLWGREDQTLDLDDFDSYANPGTPQVFGLTIRKEVHIDLNKSTLKAVICKYPHYIMIKIGRRLYNDEVSTDSDNPTGTSIVNGKVFAARDDTANLIPTIVNLDLHHSWEHYKCIDAENKVYFANMQVGNSIGDGFCLASKDDYANNPEISFGEQKYLNPTTGKAVSSSNNNNTWCSGFNVVSAFRYNYYDYKLILRPYLGTNTHSYVDMASKFIDERYTVCYYTGANENAFINGASEILQFGDTLNIPNNATHFRVSIDIDSSYYVNSGNITAKLICITIDQGYGTIAENCDVNNCGRDGFTLSSIYNGLIKNCRIFGCAQDEIDIESLAYADKAITLDGIICNAISSTTPHNILIKNSRINYLKTDCPYYIIDNCDINYLLLVAPDSRDSHFNISMPKRIVSNSIIRNEIKAINCLFDNCVILADYPVTGGYNYHTYGFHLNTYNNCVFKSIKIFPGIYTNCTFVPREIDVNSSRNKIVRDLELQNYYYSRLEESNYTFNNCKFDVASISSFDNNLHHIDYRNGVILDVTNCEFKIDSVRGNQGDPTELDGRGTNFGHCYIKRFSNNRIKINVISSPVHGNATSFPITFNLYNNAEINNNVFEPLSKTSASRFIRIVLNNIFSNDVYDIDIKNNIVKYYSTTSSTDSIFLFVQSRAKNNKININVVNNTFILLPAVSTEVIDLPLQGTDGVWYSLEKYPYHYYKWIATVISTFENDGEEGIVYYSTVKRKFYYWSDSASVDTTTNKYREINDRHENGYRLVKDYIIDVATLPGSNIDGNVIYHDTTADKHYRYIDNNFVQVDNQMGIKDVVLTVSADSSSADYVPANSSADYAPNVKIKADNKCIVGILTIPVSEDSRIQREITI